VVDFRGFDTMIEITVFGVAGAAIYSLMRNAAKKHRDDEDEERELSEQSTLTTMTSRGIGGTALSPMIQTAARLVLPVSIMLAFVHMIYGHGRPGDGFTAGVIVAIAVGLYTLAFGRADAFRRLPWLQPGYLIGGGWLIVMLGSLLPMLWGQPFFSPFDFGQWLNLPLPHDASLSASFLFEIAICFTVIGSASWTLRTLAR
jgi:multisubunit Na+/H+ antiporter MnhB subunit